MPKILNKSAAGKPAAKKINVIYTAKSDTSTTGAIRGGLVENKAAHTDIQNGVITGKFVTHHTKIISQDI